MTHRLAIVCLMFFAGGAVGSAQDWPQFRGGQGGVAADHPSLPDTWSETQNVVWKIDLPGRGWSSPIVWGDHVFVTTAINLRQPQQRLLPPEAYRGASTGGTMSRRDLVRDTDEFRWTLYDVDAASGRVRWERAIHTAVPTRPVHMKNLYASETPVTDGQRVYVYLGYVGLFAYDMNGELAWAKPMAARNTGNDGFFYGGGASPALHDGRLYVVNDNEEESFIAAFDARTGAELWRRVRDERSNWSTPFVWQNALRTEIVTVGSRKLRSYDVNGALLWELAVGTTLHTPTPFARDGILYASSGYFSDPRRPVFAIRPGAVGTPKSETVEPVVDKRNENAELLRIAQRGSIRAIPRMGPPRGRKSRCFNRSTPCWPSSRQSSSRSRTWKLASTSWKARSNPPRPTTRRPSFRSTISTISKMNWPPSKPAARSSTTN